MFLLYVSGVLSRTCQLGGSVPNIGVQVAQIAYSMGISITECLDACTANDACKSLVHGNTQCLLYDVTKDAGTISFSGYTYYDVTCQADGKIIEPLQTIINRISSIYPGTQILASNLH